MSENGKYHTFIRIAGILSILSASGFLGTMLTNFVGLDRLTYGWLGLFGTVTLVPSMVGLYLYQKDDAVPHHLLNGFLLMMVGVIFLVLIYLTAMLESTTQAVIANASDPVLAEASETFFNGLNLVSIIIGSFLTYGISALLLGLAGRTSSTLPQWIAWLAIIGGIAGFTWLGFVWLLPFNFLIFAPSAILITIWQYAIGVFMFRSKAS